MSNAEMTDLFGDRYYDNVCAWISAIVFYVAWYYIIANYSGFAGSTLLPWLGGFPCKIPFAKCAFTHFSKLRVRPSLRCDNTGCLRSERFTCARVKNPSKWRV